MATKSAMAVRTRVTGKIWSGPAPANPGIHGSLAWVLFDLPDDATLSDES